MSAPWVMACPDWRERLLEGRTLVPDLPLFQTEAQRALRVFKRLRISDITGTPTIGTAGAPFLFPIVAAIFGSYDPNEQRRMIQEYFWMIPKGNWKTGSAAAIMLTALIVNRRPEAELTLLAPRKEVADRGFAAALGSINLDPALRDLFRPSVHTRTITHLRNGSTLKVVAADIDTVTGIKSTFTLLDESHEFSLKSKAPELFVEIRGSLGKRPDGFFIQITTQSKAPPVGTFKADVALARDVRDGKVTDFPLLPILYELPLELAEKGGWKNRKYWPLLNPNLGKSIQEKFLEVEVERAERLGAQQLALIASQHFNVEIGLGLRTDRWAGADHWEAAADADLAALPPAERLAALLARCDVVVIGIDGGGLDDLLGLAILGREKVTRRKLLWTHAWLYRGGFDTRKSEQQKYLDLVEAGDLTIFENLAEGEGEVGEDVIQLVDLVEQVRDAKLLPDEGGIGVDPVGISAVIDELERRRISTKDSKLVVAVTQGWRLTNTIKDAERQTAAKTLRHCAQLLMAWAVGNAKVAQRGNAIAITKQDAGTAKIDPLMAMFNAVALMAHNPEPGGSVYTADRGIKFFDLSGGVGSSDPGMVRLVVDQFTALHQYLLYFENTGREALSTSDFDEDWAPIGPRIRMNMVEAGLATVSRGTMVLTTLALDVLSALKERTPTIDA